MGLIQNVDLLKDWVIRVFTVYVGACVCTELKSKLTKCKLLIDIQVSGWISRRIRNSDILEN